MAHDIHICGPHLSVPGETECLEACYSNGRACRKCPHPTCYRVGMTAKESRADNARRVRENGGMWWDEKDTPKMLRQAGITAAMMESPEGRKKLGMPPMESREFVPDFPGDTPEKQHKRRWGKAGG